MKRTQHPIRLLTEVLVIAAIAQFAVWSALPHIAHGLSAPLQSAMAAGLLVLLAAPTVYWRCMARVTPEPARAARQVLSATTTRSAVALTAGAQALGLLLTAGCVVWQHRSLEAETQARFDRNAERAEAEVRRTFALPLYGLNGLRGLYAAQGEVSGRAFKDWVASRNLPVEFPGVRGFGFVERVARADLDRFVAARRADAGPDYRIETEGDAPDLYPVKYAEPIATNGAALGRDVGREPVRREAVERALREGRPALSGKIDFRRQGPPLTGFLYFVPVYAGDAASGTPTSRLVGLLFAPLVAAELMQGVAKTSGGEYSIELFDGGTVDPLRAVFGSLQPTGAAVVSSLAGASAAASPPGVSASAAAAAARPPALQTLRRLDVGGRTLTLRVSSTPMFDTANDRSRLAFVAFGGVLASMIMSLAVWLLAVGRVRAQRRAERMTADLAQLARVVQHTSNAVVITDAGRRITWVNEGFTRITGFGFEEAVGRTTAALLAQAPATDLLTAPGGDGGAARASSRAVVLNRAKDGREVWIDTEVQTTLNATGGVTGYMELGSDITALKLAQFQLEAAVRESDALLRTVNRHAIVSVTDRAGVITAVNPAFCAISGWRSEELIGQTHRVVNSGHHTPTFWSDMWRVIASGAPWRGEICNRAKDGTLYWVDSMIAPFTGADGRIEKYVSIRTDISASKAAQLELSRMADRLALAIEGGSDGLWDWMDVRAPAVWTSPTFADLLGTPVDDLPSDVSGFARLVNRRHLRSLRRAAEAALAGGTPLDAELLLRTGHDGYRWFRARAKVIHGDDGRAARMAGSLQDIHDRKQAERDLGRERKRLDRILEGTNVGTWEWDIEGGEVRVDERWAQISGYAASELQPTTIDTWAAPTHPDDRMRSAVLLEQHLDGVTDYYGCESRTRHKDGRWVWVLDRGKLFSRGSDGRPRWMAGTRMDITQRKQAEQALRDSEAFLDQAGRIAGVGGWRVELASNTVIWSTETYRIHEVEPGYEPTVETAIAFYAAEGRPAIESAVQLAIASGQAWDLELPLNTATGRRIWVRAVGEVELEQGRPVRLVGAFQDITERRLLDEKLRRNHELMNGVLQNLPCGLGAFDGELKLLAHNSQFRELLELPAEVIGAPGVTFDRLVRYSAEHGELGSGDIETIVQDVVAHARQPRAQFFERVRATGVPLEIRRAPLPSGGFVATYIDITERKQAEAQLKDALARAEQASVTKSQFLANMSHEIRTPMNAILGMLSLMRRTELTPRQLDYTAKTEGAARSLLGLLNDILDFSKAEAGKMTLDPRPFRLDGLLCDLSVILSANLGTKTIDVLYDVDPALPACVVGDDQRLQQVLINLGGNAIKFTTAGEVVLKLRVVERTDGDVLIEFAMRDTGIGIAPEHHARIFAGFSQAEASTTRRFGGTGLGLAISQRLLALMGAELRLDSDVGAGSTFRFELRLPLAEPAASAIADASATAIGAAAARRAAGREAVDRTDAAGCPRALRALIVDDNATAREVIVGMAQALGWQANDAEGGRAAVTQCAARAAQGVPYDAVFLDWKMPGLDGWQTARQIVADAAAAGSAAPLVVMLTGHGRETLLERSAEEQATLSGFLVKPVTASMLLQAVTDADAAARPVASAARGPSVPPALLRLAGMRLLIVEDNPNNQQVAQELLTEEGAEVTLAANGRIGLDILLARHRDFDAVLMDIQMPVMDGYIATAHIRREPSMDRLPVIAMTANAMASDREACLAAGMNDHVGKPFDLSDLIAVLQRHTGRGNAAAPADPAPWAASAPAMGLADGAASSASASAAASASASASGGAAAVVSMSTTSAQPDGWPAPLLDTARERGIDLAAAIGRMGGNTRVYRRTLMSFRDDLRTMPDELAAALRSGDTDVAARLMHTVRGVAATLGIGPLAALASQAETALRQPPAQALPARPWPTPTRKQTQMQMSLHALPQPSSPVVTASGSGSTSGSGSASGTGVGWVSGAPASSTAVPMPTEPRLPAAPSAGDAASRPAGPPAAMTELLERLARSAKSTVQDITALAAALDESLQALADVTATPAPRSGSAAAEVALPQAPSGPEAAATREELCLALDRLSGLLRNADMGALELFERLRAAQPDAADADWSALDDALASLDFETAETHARALRRKVPS